MSSIAALLIPLFLSSCRVFQSALNKRISSRPGFGILRATIVNNLVNIPLFLALFLIPRYVKLHCSVDSPPDSFCTTIVNLFDDSYAFSSFKPFYAAPGACAFFIVFSVPILIKRMSALRVFVQLTFVEVAGSLLLDKYMRDMDVSWGRVGGSAIVFVGALVIAGGGSAAEWLRKNMCGPCGSAGEAERGEGGVGRIGVNNSEHDPLMAPVSEGDGLGVGRYDGSAARPAASWNGELRNDLPGIEYERQFQSAAAARQPREEETWFSVGDAEEEARFLRSVVAGGAATHHSGRSDNLAYVSSSPPSLLTSIGLNALCITIGVARLMQGNLNAIIVDAWGIGGASLLNGIMFSATTTILFAIVRLATIRDLAPNPGRPRGAWWFVFPGLLGATVVVLLPISIILLGSLTTFIIVILGELLTAAVYDALFEGKPISLPRILGLLFVFGGLAVTFEYS
jgi:transporter family-2 protein